MVWIPGWWGQNLLGINIHTNKMSMYPLPTLDSGPYMTKVDKDHVVWMNFQNSDTIAKFDPRTERWVEYPLPTLGTEIHAIGILDRNGSTEVSLAEERTFKSRASAIPHSRANEHPKSGRRMPQNKSGS